MRLLDLLTGLFVRIVAFLVLVRCVLTPWLQVQGPAAKTGASYRRRAARHDVPSIDTGRSCDNESNASIVYGARVQK